MKRKHVFAVSVLFFTICTALTVSAGGSPEDSGQAIHVTEEGIAAQGADVVAYYSLDAGASSVLGNARYSYDWQGATWYFVNEENLSKFSDDPDAYAPQFGGYCAWAIARDKLATIDPDKWDIVDGKLYLNYNDKTQREWQDNQAADISKGNEYWPEKQAGLLDGS